MPRNFANTVSRDYRVVDGTETVTLTQGATVTTITKADAHDLTVREIAGAGGMWAMGDRRWGLGAAQVPSPPLGGQTITDIAGVVWSLIGDATIDDLGISWFCVTRRAR